MYESHNIQTVVRTLHCEYSGRTVPVFYTYTGGSLSGIECPKNGCAHSSRCKAFQDAPQSLSDAVDT